jgi:hypothetical protein
VGFGGDWLTWSPASLLSLPSWSPARSASRREIPVTSRRRRPLFGSGCSLPPIRNKDILTWNRISRLVLGPDPLQPSLCRAGSLKPARVSQLDSAQLVQCFGSTRPASTQSTRPESSQPNSPKPVQFSGSSRFRPGSASSRPGSAHFRPVQLVSGPVQASSDPVQTASSPVQLFQAGSVQAHFGSVQLVSDSVQVYLCRFLSILHTLLLVLLCFWASLLLLIHFVVDSTQHDYY